MSGVPALLELQSRFMAALFDDAAPSPSDGIAGNGLDAAARLRIYRHSSEAIQTGALRTSYPAVLALLGEAFFEQTVRGYRAARPSCSGNLQVYGDHLADYLAELPALRDWPWLPDVARLEWLRQEAALAADDFMLHSREPRAAMHASVRLLASPYALLSIWRYAMQPDGERLTLSGQGEQVMLWREDGQVAMAAVDAASFASIQSLVRGGSLNQACHAGCLVDADFDFSACIASLVEHRLLQAQSLTDIFEEASS